MPPIPKSVLKAYFEKGDKPTQSQFYSLIDSSLNMVDDLKYLGLKIYNSTLPYEPGDITVHDGLFYEAIATTSGAFDPSKWAELSSGGGGGTPIVSITYSALAALKTASNLVAGQLYYISDKGAWLRAMTTSELNLSGQYLAVNADYQSVNENCLGIWNATLTGIVVGINFVIWNNLHWMSLTGSAGSAPDFDPTNWELIPTTDPSYILEIDEIKYDFDLDFIFERSDKRGNFVCSLNDPGETFGLIPIERFQWGRHGVIGNFVKNSILDIANCEALNFSVTATDFSMIVLTENANCSNAIFSGSSISLKANSDLQMSIMRNSGLRSITTVVNTGKRAEPGFSDFEATIDITGASLLDLSQVAYAGIVNLTSGNTSETLANFNFSPIYPIELRPAPGLDVEIVTGAMFPNEFVMPVPSLLLKGDFADYAKFRSGPGDTLRYMEAVNYTF